MSEELTPDVDLSQVPLAPNPNGDPPDFENGPSLETTILSSGIVFIVLGFVAIFLRLGMSWKNTRGIHLDDWFCFAGMVLGFAYWIILYELQISQGLGRHTWDVPVTAVTESVMQGQAAAQVLTAAAHLFVKGAILLFFVRLFGTVRWVRLVCYGLFAIVVVLYSAYLAGLLAMCVARPGEEWGSETLLARCDSTTPATITMGVCAMLIDLAIFTIPFFIIKKLHATSARKKSLVVVFLIGFLIVVTSAVGLFYRVEIMRGTTDPIWNGARVSITAYVEIFGTVIVSCTPALSSFWFGIFVKSSIYSSLRSRFSLWSSMRNTDHVEDTEEGPKHSSSNTSLPAHTRQSGHQFVTLPSNSSTQELIDLPPVTPKVKAIEKSTTITQTTAEL